MKKYIKAAEENNGIFWVIDDELYAFPFYDELPTSQTSGISNSGLTFNHRRLWEDVAPRKYKNKPFDYFPRGRVEFKSDGTPVIYMSPDIDESYVRDIKREFGLRQEPVVNYDHSRHYMNHLDDGYRPQR